jgi:xanthine dehydrogenase accessory factor
MKEITDIIKAYDEAAKAGKQSALATVVNVEGSSYRRPGARMLVTDDGMLTGAISGGCLEGDALRKALLVMQQQKPMLATYDTTDEDDAKLGVQLGCNGIVHILIEPIDTADSNNPIELLKIVAAKRRNAVIATLFSLQNRKAAQPGTCMLLTEEGVIRNNFTSDELQMQVLSDMQQALHRNHSSTKEYNTDTVLTCFIELITPPVSLILFGAGNDAIPVMQMAAVLGWQLTVVDGRSNHATRQRFPLAQRVIVANAVTALGHLSLNARTAVVLMTHNYNYDIAMLQQLLPLQVPYVGVLGPKKKLDRMLHELEKKGIEITPEQLQHIYGPTGLDIGAEASEEIALSVLAEIKAVITGRNGSSLRIKQHTIHTHI